MRQVTVGTLGTLQGSDSVKASVSAASNSTPPPRYHRGLKMSQTPFGRVWDAFNPKKLKVKLRKLGLT